jgi:trehalose synthase
MLEQADQISKKYALEVAKLPPPLPTPQTQKCLDTASVWFTIDLCEVATEKGSSVFQTLACESLWDRLREIGVEGIHLTYLKQGGPYRTGLALNPCWGTECEWQRLSSFFQKKGMALIGDAIGRSTGLSADFWLALENKGDYPGLYHLIEIDPKDWKLLPNIPHGQFTANIPWLSIQNLHKKGYIPEFFAPYVKESDWNATDPISGSDGKARRWVYLKENQAEPVIDWLNSSFAAMRIATADSLDSVYRLGQKIFQLDASLAPYAQETLPAWIRKIGAFSVQHQEGGLKALKQPQADLSVDTLTRPALLHALIAEDTEALRLIYSLFIKEGIQPKNLVHILQPFDRFATDWKGILEPKKKYLYHEEYITGELLRAKLLKEDVQRLNSASFDPIPPSTWPGYCALALKVTDFEKQRDLVLQAHLLLAFFYAAQPGAFSFSVSDLVGALPHSEPSYDLNGINETTLYPSLPIQMGTSRSFASQLRQILRVRKDYDLKNAELTGIYPTPHPQVLLLLLKLQGKTELLAVNFGRTQVTEKIELIGLQQTTAINLMTQLAEEKAFDSSLFFLNLPPLSGKIIVFQPRFYD